MKQAIIADLQTLVNAGTLGAVISNDYSKINPLDQNIAETPVAIVLPPLVSTSAYEDVGHNLREYTWYILIADLPEHVNGGGDGYLEELMDAVLEVFDLDCTLQGTAVGAVMPAVQEPPGIISGNNITYATFYVTFKAKALVQAAVSQ